MFFIIGGVSLLWLAPWLAVASRLETATARGSAIQPGFSEILGKREAWGTFCGLFAGNYAWYFLLTWLPPYLLMERHWSREMMALHGSLPYWTLAASSLAGGRLSDWLIRRGLTPTRVRRSFLAGGLAGSSLLVPACLSHSDAAAMALLIASCIPLGLWSSNVWAVTQTLAGPGAAGRWTGLQNAFGNLAGVTVPWLTGVLVKQTGSFHAACFSVAGVVCAGSLAVVILVPEVAPVAWRRHL
jgi:nitrate/nitrite transporter NarK